MVLKLKLLKTGIYMMPIYEGRTLEEEEFNKLDDSIKQQFEDKSGIVQEHIMNTISEIKMIEKHMLFTQFSHRNNISFMNL